MKLNGMLGIRLEKELYNLVTENTETRKRGEYIRDLIKRDLITRKIITEDQAKEL